MRNLTRIGQVVAHDKETGEAIEFFPSFSCMAAIGAPAEIVKCFADLHSESRSLRRVTADLILHCCAVDGDLDIQSIPENERVIIAAHLMLHGVSGVGDKNETKSKSGEYSSEFDPSEFVDAGMIHLGLSPSDAWGMSMTQFQRAMRMKFPKEKHGAADITPEQYDKDLEEYEQWRKRSVA